MKQLSSILMVGWYPELLLTRAAMLRLHGYAVMESRDAQHALRILATTDFALVVVCRSIPRKVRKALIRDMKHARPLTPVLVFGHGMKEADLSIPNLAGPEVFLRCVSTLVRGAKRRSG